MKTWFEGSSDIECTIEHVRRSLDNLGEHYVGVIALMPSLSAVELVNQGEDSVEIKTNEGVLRRTNIVRKLEGDRVIVEFEEEYRAGSVLTTKGHFLDEFTSTSSGVRHRMVISGLEAPGILGFFYRKFGSTNIGTALLQSYKHYLEQDSGRPG